MGETIATNKKAFFNYEIVEDFEAGIVLVGSEVKSIREGRVSIRDAHCRVSNDEVFLINMHVTPYEKTTHIKLDATRTRKLLLNRLEILRLDQKVREKGFTIVPLEIYFKRGHAKVRIGLGRGKREFEKKRRILEREREREIRRTLRKFPARGRDKSR